MTRSLTVLFLSEWIAGVLLDLVRERLLCVGELMVPCAKDSYSHGADRQTGENRGRKVEPNVTFSSDVMGFDIIHMLISGFQ